MVLQDGFSTIMIQTKSIKAKIANYFFMKFSNINDLRSVNLFVEKFFDNMIYVVSDGEIVGVSAYIMVSDEMLDMIRHKIVNLSDTNGFSQALESDGDNIHFFCVAVNETRFMRKGLRKIMRDKKPKTVSWFNQDITEFNCYKGDR